jgi:hypothetical protein
VELEPESVDCKEELVEDIVVEVVARVDEVMSKVSVEETVKV